MKLASWFGWLAVAGVAAALVSFGCETLLLNDVPGGEGWGPRPGGGAGGMAGTGGTGGTGAQGGAEMCGINPCYCYDCHGTIANQNSAPPPDIDGNSSTQNPSVGAHQSHMVFEPDWHSHQGCDLCHDVPVLAAFDPAHPLHINNTNDLTWGALPQSGGLSPEYDEQTHTCTDTWCHGAGLPGAGAGGGGTGGGAAVMITPVWTEVDGSHDACGTACHLNPSPSVNHQPTDTDCALNGCHSGVMTVYVAGDPSANVWTDETLHINGIVDYDQ